MATLTTSWQSYASASYTASAGAKLTFYLEARYSSQSVENNTSVVYTRLRSTITGGSIRGSGYEFACTYCDKRSGTGVWTFENEVIISSSAKTITHNTDGSKSISLSATAKNTYWNINKSMSVTVDLPKINRLATVISANDFTDEENPTLTFDNPAGFDVKPYLNFYDTNNNLVYSLSRETLISSPYTWDLTTEERNSLRNATNLQSNYRVQVGVNTYNNNTQLGYNSIAKQMTYVNATPTQTISLVETNQDVIALFGGNIASTIIQGISQLKFTIVPATLKGAIVSKVELDGVVSSDVSSPYEFADVIPTTGSFIIKTTDSRGLVIESTITKQLILYQPIDVISVSFNRMAPTSSDVILNAEIRYIQANFDGTPNLPSVKWKKGESGSLNTIASSDYTIDVQNNKIIISNLNINNAIPYNEDSRFYLYVEDLLTSDSDSDIVDRGIPTYDAGEHDFQVNGDFFIADTNRTNPMNIKEKIEWLNSQNVLWKGGMYVNASQSIDLTNNPISSQPHGVVLIWSAYENGEAKDWDFAFNFIPKKFVSLHGSKGVCFTMSTGTFANIGAKYLYISDKEITGNNNNSAVGTASGISYKNNYWVLRYVIGV